MLWDKNYENLPILLCLLLYDKKLPVSCHTVVWRTKLHSLSYQAFELLDLMLPFTGELEMSHTDFSSIFPDISTSTYQSYTDSDEWPWANFFGSHTNSCLNRSYQMDQRDWVFRISFGCVFASINRWGCFTAVSLANLR